MTTPSNYGHRFHVAIGGTDRHGDDLPPMRLGPLTRGDVETIGAAVEAAKQVSDGFDRAVLSRLGRAVRDILHADDAAYRPAPPPTAEEVARLPVAFLETCRTAYANESRYIFPGDHWPATDAYDVALEHGFVEEDGSVTPRGFAAFRIASTAPAAGNQYTYTHTVPVSLHVRAALLHSND